MRRRESLFKGAAGERAERTGLSRSVDARQALNGCQGRAVDQGDFLTTPMPSMGSKLQECWPLLREIELAGPDECGAEPCRRQTAQDPRQPGMRSGCLEASPGAGRGEAMTLAMHQVLIIQSGEALQHPLQALFESSGFRVAACRAEHLNGTDAQLHRCDMVMVDLAPAEGLRVIQTIRGESEVPVMMLSAHADEADRVGALEAGADDYVLKPFSARELIARVRAILRRRVRGELPMGMLQLGRVLIDLARRTAHRSDGIEVRLTPMEHRILETLVRHADRIVSQPALLREVWGPRQGDSQELRVYIGNLRKKLEEDPARPAYIVTEARLGYRLVLGSRDRTPGSAERLQPDR